MRKSSIFLLSIALLSGCATTIRTDGSKGLMQGMLYDYDNRPVCGYELILDNKMHVFTDINGRFEFPSSEYRTHTLTGNGNGYEAVDRAYDFANRGQILYLRIPSIENLYCQLDTQLVNGQNDKAEKILQTLSKTEQTQNKFKLYSAILRLRKSSDTDKNLLIMEIKTLESKIQSETIKIDRS